MPRLPRRPPTHLHHLVFLGIDATGSLPSRWTVPADTLVRLPPARSLEHAASAEPTAVAVHDVRRAQLRTGEKALVVGGGPIGVLVAVAARRAGADLLVVEPDPYRRTVAEALGPATLDPTAVDAVKAVTDWTDDRIPAGRWARPEDLGGAAVFLAPAASDHVHGVPLSVDGGRLGR
ncbi:SDR family oxidoreductase [Streptomyces sp. NPDC048385]|uniref:SDR family oxidoreductase n=1 Tax=unclassified Streptomyces TaxID=2593676 RepID=UPI0034442534